MQSRILTGGGISGILDTLTTETQTEFEITICSLIINTLSPISVVESEHLNYLVVSCDRSIVVPRRYTIRRRIIYLEQHVLCQVQTLSTALTANLV